MQRNLLVSIAGLALIVSVAAAQTATLTLDSPQAGQIVAPGSTVNWSIAVTVSNDNAGLALVICDLVQDPANPALFDIPPADPGSIDSTMQNFDRPAGITNPGDQAPLSGYVGVQRGNAGQMNLIQIGGGQNTFGQALAAGTGLGENANVICGVGQGGPQVVVSGSFTMPTTCGDYTFSLANPIVNVMTACNTPPDFSPVTQATVDTSAASITVSVTLQGDLNGDGSVDLSDLSVLLATYNLCAGDAGYNGAADIDGDDCVGLSDLSILLANYGGSCS